jgi:hypothetical protein
MSGKVVVNRAMSLDGFIAGPGHAMDSRSWPRMSRLVAPDDFAQIAAATGAMLVGRGTWDVGDKMEADERASLVYVLPMLAGDGIPFSSPCLARVDLEPISSKRSGAVTILRYRVAQF